MPEEIKYTVVTETTFAYPEAGKGKHLTGVKDESTGLYVALFASESDARDYRYWKSQTAEQRLDAALSTVRQDYYQDVRDTAESIKAELLDRVKDQECGDSLREWLQEHIHETIDGSSRVIYTQSAMLGLFASDHDGEYFEQFGDDGVVEDGSVNWSRLCFSAFERDVIDQLGSIGVDVNEPLPACEDCGEDDQDTERYIVGDTDDVLCETCKEAREADSAEDQDGEISIGSSVVLTDDPNGTVFTVLSIHGDSVTVSVPDSTNTVNYEMSLLQIAEDQDQDSK